MPGKHPAARRVNVQAVCLYNVYYGSVHGPGVDDPFGSVERRNDDRACNFCSW